MLFVLSYLYVMHVIDDIMNSLNAKTNGYIQLTQALISSQVYPVNFPAKTGSFDHKKIRNRVTTIL